MRLAEFGMCREIDLPPATSSAQQPDALAEQKTDVGCHLFSIRLCCDFEFRHTRTSEEKDAECATNAKVMGGALSAPVPARLVTPAMAQSVTGAAVRSAQDQVFVQNATAKDVPRCP